MTNTTTDAARTMPQKQSEHSATDDDRSQSTAKPSDNSATDDLGPADRVQWFGRPEDGEQPLGFWRLVVITLSGHLGVRSRARRHEDFRRANGLHVFIAAIIYFVVVIIGLIVLTNVIASR